MPTELSSTAITLVFVPVAYKYFVGDRPADDEDEAA